MPQATGDRFSSQNMLDCAFCRPEGRRFRTLRQCNGCGKPLCLICRPEAPELPFLCPDCGGGGVEDAIHQPAVAIRRIEEAGRPAPFWLLDLQERLRTVSVEDVEELIAPE